MEKGDGSNVGEYQHLSLTAMVSYSLPYPSRTVLPEQPQGLGGEAEGLPQYHLLLVLAEEEATGDRKYGLSTIWVNPCQAKVHSMEEAVGKLTAWVSSGPNWPTPWYGYTRAPTMHHSLRRGTWASYLKGGVETTPCRQISQLEVCQLLISGLQVTYPIGLNGCEEAIITSLPGSLANGISLTGGKSVYLEIDIPQSLAGEPDLKVPPIGELSSIIMASPHKATSLNQKERLA